MVVLLSAIPSPSLIICRIVNLVAEALKCCKLRLKSSFIFFIRFWGCWQHSTSSVVKVDFLLAGAVMEANVLILEVMEVSLVTLKLSVSLAVKLNWRPNNLSFDIEQIFS